MGVNRVCQYPTLPLVLSADVLTIWVVVYRNRETWILVDHLFVCSSVLVRIVNIRAEQILMPPINERDHIWMCRLGFSSMNIQHRLR